MESMARTGSISSAMEGLECISDSIRLGFFSSCNLREVETAAIPYLVIYAKFYHA